MRSLITLFTIRLKIRLLNYYENSRRIIFHQVFPQSRAFREKCKSIKNYVIYAMEVPPWHDDIWWQASQSKNKPNPIPCSMQFSVYGILNKSQPHHATGENICCHVFERLGWPRWESRWGVYFLKLYFAMVKRWVNYKWKIHIFFKSD